MKHLRLFEHFLAEQIIYPDGDKSSGNKILDKVAKLLNSTAARIEITVNQVRMIGWWNGSISKRPENKFYVLNTPLGFFRLEEDQIRTAEDLYDEVESIYQARKPKRAKESDMFGKLK